MTFYPTTEVPYELQMLIDGELEREEKLLWTGRPKSTRFFWRTLPIVLFGIPWTAFAIFWMFGAAGFKIPNFRNPESYFCLFGLPFVLIGLGMLSSPLWTIRKARRTAYAVTNKRALIFIQGRQTKIESLAPNELTKITKQIRKDGSGDLIFNQGWNSKIPFKNTPNVRPGENGFYGIPQVNEAEKIIRDVVATEAHPMKQDDYL